MTSLIVQKLLLDLLKQINALSDSDYTELCEITHSENFISLGERQVASWFEISICRMKVMLDEGKKSDTSN